MLEIVRSFLTDADIEKTGRAKPEWLAGVVRITFVKRIFVLNRIWYLYKRKHNFPIAQDYFIQITRLAFQKWGDWDRFKPISFGDYHRDPPIIEIKRKMFVISSSCLHNPPNLLVNNFLDIQVFRVSLNIPDSPGCRLMDIQFRQVSLSDLPDKITSLRFVWCLPWQFWGRQFFTFRKRDKIPGGFFCDEILFL